MIRQVLFAWHRMQWYPGRLWGHCAPEHLNVPKSNVKLRIDRSHHTCQVAAAAQGPRLGSLPGYAWPRSVVTDQPRLHSAAQGCQLAQATLWTGRRGKCGKTFERRSALVS